MKTATAPAALCCTKTNYVSVKFERANNAFRLFRRVHRIPHINIIN